MSWLIVICWSSSVIFTHFFPNFGLKIYLFILGLCDCGRVEFIRLLSPVLPNFMCHRPDMIIHSLLSTGKRDWSSNYGIRDHWDPIIGLFFVLTGEVDSYSSPSGDRLKWPWDFLGSLSGNWKWSKCSWIHSGKWKESPHGNLQSLYLLIPKSSYNFGILIEMNLWILIIDWMLNLIFIICHWRSLRWHIGLIENEGNGFKWNVDFETLEAKEKIDNYMYLKN